MMGNIKIQVKEPDTIQVRVVLETDIKTLRSLSEAIRDADFDYSLNRIKDAALEAIWDVEKTFHGSPTDPPNPHTGD